MKTPKHLAIVILLFVSMPLFFISCTIEDETPPATDTVNWGYVKEYYTEKPIPNAMLVLYGKNPLWVVQDTLYTDANGRYEFPIVKYLPELQASASGYFPSGMVVYAPGDFYEEKKRTIHLYQPAEMILHVKNVKPTDDNDAIRLNDFWPPVIVSGKEADTMICCLVSRRYQTARLQTVVRRNRNQNIVDSIIVYEVTPTKAIGNIVSIFY
ncbi:MAG: hypothetical protein V4590_10390 [Bacteroidota bacterium]